MPKQALRPATGVRAAYDAIASAYDDALADELDRKPVDRALLTAFVELAGSSGTIADVGCGPGHVTRFLARQHAAVVGIDLSPGMIAIARKRAPQLPFIVGSMTHLPVAPNACAGAIVLYSIIHLTSEERVIAFRELARVLRAGGWLLVAFHVDSASFQAGDVNHLTEWFGQPVDIDGYFLEPDMIGSEVRAAGFEIRSTLIRQPEPDVEYRSRRCYLLARRQ